MDSVTPNIWQLQSRVDIDGLSAALSHADPEVRRKAAAALRALDAAEAVPALKTALASETDWEAQATLLAAIQHLTREDTLDVLIEQRNVEALVNLLFSDWTHDVLGAIEALGELGEKQASESLVVIFRTTELPDELRYAAAQALLRLKCAPAVVTLLAALRRDDWEVRQNAAAMLGELHATWATHGLIEALDDSVPEVREAARGALAKIGTPTALKALESADAAVMVVLETLETTAVKENADQAVVEQPVAENQPAAENQPVAEENPPAPEDQSAAEIAPAAEPLPAAENPPAAEIQPVAENELEVADSPAAETLPEPAPAVTGDDPYATTELPALPASDASVDQTKAPQPVPPEQLLLDLEDVEEEPGEETEPEAADLDPNGTLDALPVPESDLDDTVVRDAAHGEVVFDEDDLDIPYGDDGDDADEDSASFYPVDVAF